jgi:hypothetical protein
MTLAVTPADIEWFLEQVPGTSAEEIERFKKRGMISIDGEDEP